MTLERHIWCIAVGGSVALHGTIAALMIFASVAEAPRLPVRSGRGGLRIQLIHIDDTPPTNMQRIGAHEPKSALNPVALPQGDTPPPLPPPQTMLERLDVVPTIARKTLRPAPASRPQPAASVPTPQPTTALAQRIPAPTSHAPAHATPTATPGFAKGPVAHTTNKPPIYPATALRRGQTGVVTLRLHVAPDGRVSHAKLVTSSGVDTLDTAALTAARAWRFEPALVAGQAVPCEVTVPIEFAIRAR